MLNGENFRKGISGTMLIVFCAGLIVFQNIIISNNYQLKAQQEDSLVQSFNGQLGLIEEENQSTTSNTLEEEDDDFKTESVFPSFKFFEHLMSQHLVLQDRIFSEHHPEITSPPPRG